MNVGDLLLLGLVLFIYFHTMRVEPSRLGPSMKMTLPKFMNFADSIKVAICITPIIVIYKGYDLRSNLLFVSLALTTLIAPLTIPTGDPSPEESKKIGTFLGKWLLGKLDTFIKGIVILGIIWLILKLPFIPSEQFIQAAIESKFRHPSNQPVDKHLVLPLALYIFAFVMLLIRTMMLFGGRWYHPLLGILSGWLVLNYFYNLTFKVALTADNWEAPVSGGILIALIWSFTTAFLLARVELKSKMLHGD
jgi:hypothetical protein